MSWLGFSNYMSWLGFSAKSWPHDILQNYFSNRSGLAAKHAQDCTTNASRVFQIWNLVFFNTTRFVEFWELKICVAWSLRIWSRAKKRNFFAVNLLKTVKISLQKATKSFAALSTFGSGTAWLQSESIVCEFTNPTLAELYHIRRLV